MRALSILLTMLFLVACRSESPAPAAGTSAPAAAPGGTMPPFDAATASAMLTRTLQAQERNDAAGVQADLFPCAQSH